MAATHKEFRLLNTQQVISVPDPEKTHLSEEVRIHLLCFGLGLKRTLTLEFDFILHSHLRALQEYLAEIEQRLEAEMKRIQCEQDTQLGFPINYKPLSHSLNYIHRSSIIHVGNPFDKRITGTEAHGFEVRTGCGIGGG